MLRLGRRLAVIIFILWLVFGGYQLTKRRLVPAAVPMPKDEISLLLLKLKQETGLPFGEIKEVSFSWGLGGEEICQGTPSAKTTIRGKGLAVADLPMTKQGLIGTFLEKEGFEADQANLVDEQIRGLTGYKKDHLVCLHVGRISGGQEGLKKEPVVSEAEVKCGYLVTEEERK